MAGEIFFIINTVFLSKIDTSNLLQSFISWNIQFAKLLPSALALVSAWHNYMPHVPVFSMSAFISTVPDRWPLLLLCTSCGFYCSEYKFLLQLTHQLLLHLSQLPSYSMFQELLWKMEHMRSVRSDESQCI